MRTIDVLRGQLGEIGERTKAQLDDLSRDASPVRVELAVLQMRGVLRHLERLGEELRREAT